MKRKRTYLLLALFMICMASACDGPRVIPKGKMARIYADMALADIWLQENSQEQALADKSVFYEAVFSRYGYTADDFRHSVDHYMRNPQKISLILDKSMELVTKFQKRQLKLQGADSLQTEVPLEMDRKPGIR